MSYYWIRVTDFYRKTEWTSVDGEILFRRTAISELLAGKDEPKPYSGARTYPSMDSTVFVVHRVLILIVNLHSKAYK